MSSRMDNPSTLWTIMHCCFSNLGQSREPVSCIAVSLVVEKAFTSRASRYSWGVLTHFFARNAFNSARSPLLAAAAHRRYSSRRRPRRRRHLSVLRYPRNAASSSSSISSTFRPVASTASRIPRLTPRSTARSAGSGTCSSTRETATSKGRPGNATPACASRSRLRLRARVSTPRVASATIACCAACSARVVLRAPRASLCASRSVHVTFASSGGTTDIVGGATKNERNCLALFHHRQILALDTPVRARTDRGASSSDSSNGRWIHRRPPRTRASWLGPFEDCQSAVAAAVDWNKVRTFVTVQILGRRTTRRHHPRWEATPPPGR